MRVGFRVAAGFVAIAGFLALSGCTGASGGRCEAPSLGLRTPDGDTPSDFLAILDLGGPGVATVACGPGGTVPEGYQCGPGRLVLPAGAKPIRVTVRTPGFRTARIGLEGTPPPASCGETPVDLVALPPPEHGEAWRTGFDGPAGLDLFLALAYAAMDDLGPAFAVKFVIADLDTAPAVFFQDTKRYPIHCDFARQALKLPFASCDEYAMQTYHGADRKQMAGTIYWRPEASVELDGTAVRGVFTIEYFPYDDLTPTLAGRAFDLLQERMPFAPLWGKERRLVYVPAGSMQEADAARAARELAAGNIVWIARSALYAGVTRQYLNPAESYGRLRVMSPEDLDQAAVSFKDILILTRLPNDLPLVGGTITEELQTPLAHVNVAARARGTPNLALLGASKDPAVAPLIGKIVHFVVTPASFSLTEATVQEMDDWWQKQVKPPLKPEADLTRDGLAAFDDLHVQDASWVGVKAANVSELHHILGSKAPDGFAVPFHYFDTWVRTTGVDAMVCKAAEADCRDEGRPADRCGKVLALCLGPGGTAGETMAALQARILEDAGFRSDSELRFAVLDSLRFLYCHLPQDPAFAAELDARVAARFGTTPVRLRSSSNAEDLPNFTGAGLYTSVSAAIGSDKPPSRRICKVWGSIWNWQAFEERGFWNVDHSAVVMGVAVHPSFPDEAANGVLITRAQPGLPWMYANVQLGETSVTNPENGAVPEEFLIVPAPDGTVQASRTRMSSLSPDAPILTDAEVKALYEAGEKVHQHFGTLWKKASLDSYALDIEFKFHGPDRLLIFKQVRPYRFAAM